MPIDLWGSLPSTPDERPTPRERREAEARRLAFREADLLPRVDARMCVRCSVSPRKGDGRECGGCIAERTVAQELKRAGAAGLVLTQGSRRDTGARLVAAGAARWATFAERKANASRIRATGTVLLMPVPE